MNKKCTRCKIEKRLEDFYTHNRHKDNKTSQCKECHGIYREEHREEKKIYQRTYRKTHKEICQKYKKLIKNRISKNISGYIQKTLQKIGNKKNGEHKSKYLGYTVEQLMQRLEVNFKPGMSWNNYGKWHIDHKKPISLFKYKSIKDPQFKSCWSLCNLQPLWIEENLKKGNRF